MCEPITASFNAPVVLPVQVYKCKNIPHFNDVSPCDGTKLSPSQSAAPPWSLVMNWC